MYYRIWKIGRSNVLIEFTNKIFKTIYGDNAIISFNPNRIPSRKRFFIIPGSNGIRWIIPKETKKGLPIINQWNPYRLSSNIKWVVIKMAYRMGILSMIPKIKEIGIEGIISKENILKNLNGDSFQTPTLYIGTPGPTQKAVVLFVDCQQLQSSYVVKIPLCSKAFDTIINEARVIKTLVKEKPQITVPKILHQDNVKGMSIQEALTIRTTGIHLTDQHLQFLLLLRINDEFTTINEHIKKVENKLKLIPKGIINNKKIFNRLENISDSTLLPSVWIHGDFAPYNCKTNKDRNFILIDWEEGFRGGLPCYDLNHFKYISQFLFRKTQNPKRQVLFTNILTEYIHKMHIPNKLINKLEIYYKIRESIHRLLIDDKDQYAFFLIRQLEEEIKYE